MPTQHLTILTGASRGMGLALAQLLLQQTGVAFSGLVYIFYKGTPRFAQIQISAFFACLRKRLLIMALENLPDSGF